MKAWLHDTVSNIWNYGELRAMSESDLLGAVIVVHPETRYHGDTAPDTPEYKKGHYICVKRGTFGLERIAAYDNLDVAKGAVEVACISITIGPGGVETRA